MACKVGFVPWAGRTMPSTRLRVYNLAKYIPNSLITNDPEKTLRCDAVVFQKRYNLSDIHISEKMKENKKVVIFDLSDPVWDKDYQKTHLPFVNHNEEYFNRMVKNATVLTFCSKNLMDIFPLEHKHPNKFVLIDREDISIYKHIKKHKCKKTIRVGWIGTRFNVPSIELVRKALERLGKIYEIEFLLIYDIVSSNDAGYYHINPFNNVKLLIKRWNIKTYTADLLTCDITVNPQLSSYKSNNKTVLSWCLGIPCVFDDYYNKLKMFIDNPRLRTSTGYERRKFCEEFYDVRISARELLNIIDKNSIK